MIRSFSISIVILLCFSIFESAILSNLTVLPAVPDFLLMCTLFFSLHNGRLYGSVSGFISGPFLDFLTAAPLGLHCLMRTVVGYTYGFFNKTFNLNGFFFPILLGFIATIFKALLLWGLSIFFPISVTGYNILSVTFLFELSMNSILTPFVFKFLGIVGSSIIITSEVTR